MTPEALAALRLHLARAIVHATDLRTDLEALADGLAAVLPPMTEDGPARRREAVASLCGFEATLPAELRRVAEHLAEVLALVGASTDPEGWLRRQLGGLSRGA